MKGLFAFKNGHYVGQVVEAEMGTMDGFPQKFVTVLTQDGKLETKKEEVWSYLSANEIVPIHPQDLDELRRHIAEARKDPNLGNVVEGMTRALNMLRQAGVVQELGNTRV